MNFRWRLLCALKVGVGIVSLQAALKVSTDFESGSANVLALDTVAQKIRITPAGDLKRGMPNWWCLRIDGIDVNKSLTLEVVAREVVIPAEGAPEGRTMPLNPNWTLPTRAAVSADGKVWQQTGPGERAGNRCVYRIQPTAGTLWLAWGPPFTPRDAQALVERLSHEHPFAATFLVATSREDRSVVGLQIREGTKPIAQRPAIFVIARQHAWEVGGSWVAAGLAEWAVSGDASATWLRRNAELWIVPLMDVDHVATGDGGKYALPQDHNRDWSDAPHWFEVAAVQQRILTLAKENRLAVFLDLHNPSSGATLQTFYVQYPPYVSEAVGKLTERFLACARAEFGGIKLNDGKPSRPEDLPIWKHISAPWVCEHGSPETVAFTSETPWNTLQATTDGYRETGSRLGRVIGHYLQQNAVP